MIRFTSPAFRATFAAEVFVAVPNSDAAELVRMAQETEPLPLSREQANKRIFPTVVPTEQPNEEFSGTTSNGDDWTIARYGSLVVVTIAGDSDDEQFADEDEAAESFAGDVEHLRSI